MAIVTDFIDLAEISISSADNPSRTDSANVFRRSYNNLRKNSTHPPRHTSVFKNGGESSNSENSSVKPTRDRMKGATISIRDVAFSIETKIKRKTVSKMILKGIR